jgi:hypothetical protein
VDDKRYGSPTFYTLLDKMAEVHSRKSHDYASNESPYGNYEFAGKLGQLFHDHRDSGFIARLAEKLYRLANIENRGLSVKNESIEDTEDDIAVIVALWISSRRDRRNDPKTYGTLRIKDIEVPKGY